LKNPYFSKYSQELKIMNHRISRRSLLGGTAALGGAAGLMRLGVARAADEPAPKFLIVLGATGGASLIDGPLAIRASESRNAQKINCYDDVNLSSHFDGLRAVKHSAPVIGALPFPVATNQAEFMQKYGKDMLVVTASTTSVNHSLAQRRSITGNEAWSGRTLQELVALEYGRQAIIPNAHLVTGTEFTSRGTDISLSSRVFGETIADPLLWPLSLHGFKGIAGGERADLVEKARFLRDEKLRQTSQFSRIFDGAPSLQKWRTLQKERPAFEKADLISKLMIAADGPQFPLAKNGLSSSALANRVRAKFPNFERDPMDAQAALAYLLLTQGVSVTATLGASFNFVYAGEPGTMLDPAQVKNLPIAFDYSHNAHRGAQAFMWNRMYRTIGSLIDLLQATEFGGGQSYWDRTMLYVATDFGRTKERPDNAPDFSSGHHLNNGFVLFSPMLKAGRVLGGVNPDTGMTYGFNLKTGAPETGRSTSEKEVFGGILNALGVSTSGSGLPDVPAMRRA
jgi:hypothetical protein